MSDTADQATFRLEPPRACLQETGTAKGRGAFAQCDFSKGALVEECPLLLVTVPFYTLPPEVQRVAFNWQVLANGVGSAIALGYGSVYNHDNPANMKYVADPIRRTLKFIAVRDIRAGEELTINYNAIGGDATWNDDNWFERMNIKPIVGS